ncbi:putative acetyl-CoA hydrolase (acetyl-CoA hydrolase/transferase family protein) [Desulforapulum autotrophicum HRM2]|uniref:Acetyl-CoA hydrolase (Acetyl-CoA hydrolase/transferase family protein) n=1 Tax=Desulforapulum autotrophicum (strain ATCC 43914 / DSM 3382 / VKM B-1955 / HRM2) TaxID=177437 RepID=C0QKG0_DESAH|nr:acetyl-CoA hydrolase/transferase C-terminal domain-containing protein [Desulforapulum autotrophicum]ACN14031.1 putative acetyl-CoA hydrolase (acetyl-CoA hydrolase/transferase family protein) [Desulforapulum autotrophicum HRM2]
MSKKQPVYFTDVEQCVDDLIGQVGKEIILAAPLALAKPTQLINAIYRRLKTDPELHFTLVTAVALEKPTWSSELEHRFLGPLVERIWGGFIDFDYVLDMRKGQIPPNFELVEFFNKAGGWMTNAHAAQNYLGSNYTHAVRDAVINRCNVLSQLVAKQEINGKILFSMSSNPDTHLEGAKVMRDMRAKGEKVAIIAQVNTNLPFMYGKAVVEPGFYDMVIDSPDLDFTLFGAPKEPINNVDWMIGLHASTLVRDGGTIQVGIGSLGDAIVAGLDMRHRENKAYCDFLTQADILSKFNPLIQTIGGTDVFKTGLLGSSEMFVDSLLELIKAGIIKRKVYEDVRLQKLLNQKRFEDTQIEDIFREFVAQRMLHPVIKESEVGFLKHFGIFHPDVTYVDRSIRLGQTEYSLDMRIAKNVEAVALNCLGPCLKNGVVLYASFFIGPQAFYTELREMDDDQLKLIDMRGVDYVNQLYGNEALKRLQRVHGRFINAGIMVTLSGAVCAGGLEDNKIISGPGGQYNFVAMAHALDDGRAVTMIRSTREAGSKTTSNVVWQYGHITIPRHLRDIVVTEYGIADLRGARDREAMTRLICIADSRFQEELLDKAKAAGKIPRDWQIPEPFTNNTPQALEEKLAAFRKKGFFKSFPFGTDFTDEEIVLGRALRQFKQKAEENKFAIMPGLIGQGLSSIPKTARPYLERMGLEDPETMQEKLMQKIVLFALKSSGAI